MSTRMVTSGHHEIENEVRCVHACVRACVCVCAYECVCVRACAFACVHVLSYVVITFLFIVLAITEKK